MLIIRRRRGESITVGDEVEIEILETSPTQVKLGIRAPKSVPVLRKEILVTRELNRAASGSAAVDDQLNKIAEQYRTSATALVLPNPAAPMAREQAPPPVPQAKRQS